MKRRRKPHRVHPADLTRDAWLDRIDTAVRIPAPDHEWESESLLAPPATAAELAAVEVAIGHPLPAGLRALYERFGVSSYVPGDVYVDRFMPESEDEVTLTTAGALLRSWDWQVPEQLLVFGGEGGDALFGVWLPASGSWHPVVAVVVDGDLAVVGDDVPSFIAGRIAASSLEDAAGGDAYAVAVLDALGVPTELRVANPEDAEAAIDAVMAWSNPKRPHPDPDPFGNPITLDELQALERLHT